MSEFYRRFLLEDGRRLNPETGRFVALAAFGKHPGWDDHVEDLGLETESLNLAKRVLYVQGVGGQIDTGAWEKLKEEHRVPAFNHTFVWQRGDQFLLGRMWSSSDGKGRTRYPMILCVHAIGVPLLWALETILPRLADVEKSCVATKSAEDVRAILSRARTGLRSMINDPAVTNGVREIPAPAALSQFVAAPVFGREKEGWYRVLYWLQSQAKAFAIGNFNLKGDLSGLRAQQTRVPLAMPTPAQAVSLWTRFFGAQVDRLVPALLVWPADQEWLDITFGEPTTQEFFCLRATRGAVPLATEIPYDFDQAFRDHAARQLMAFQSGSPRLPFAPAPALEDPSVSSTSATKRWLKSLGGKFFLAGLVLLLIAGVTAVVLEPWKQTSKPSGTETAAVTAPADEPAVPAVSRPEETVAKPQPAAAAREADLAAETRRLEEQKRQQAETAAAEAARLKAEAQKKEQARLAAESKAASAPPGTPSATNAARATVAVAALETGGALAAAVSTPAPAESRDKIITNGIGMVLLWLAGLPGSDEGGWVGKCEVRQSEYEKLAGSNPSKFTDAEQPVENVSWREAVDFCRKLSAAEDAAGRIPKGFAYQLPTQQQWDFFLGDASFDNAVTSRDAATVKSAPARAGTLPPNQFGLCDVLGNVWEWCADSDSADQKVLKGGAFNNKKVFQFKPLERTTPRRLPPDAHSPEAGFRCVLVKQP